MERLDRFMAKHPRVCRLLVTLVWVAVEFWLLWMEWPTVLTAVLIFVPLLASLLYVNAAGGRLIKKPLQILKAECDPYPFLEEMNVQRTYPGNDATKQIREIDYAMALRCVGECEKAFALLSSINIDKNPGMLPNAKVVYYNNLMDLCVLMGKHPEAVIWYEKTAQIFGDMRPGKLKENLRSTVESNRALYHFCKGEYDRALQALGQAKVESLSDRIENAMMYGRVYLAMGEAEKAVRPLTFVAENGNKLYFAEEARQLLEKIPKEA